MSTEHDIPRPVRSGMEERDYMLRCAEDHRRLAEETEEAGARSIHQRLQLLYEERAALVMVHPD